MPTPEQWQKYVEAQNKYRYGQPIVSPENLVGRQVIDKTANAISSHINRPDTGEPNLPPVNYGFGATPPVTPTDQSNFPPLAATPGKEWESLDAKYGIKRPEPGSLPTIDKVLIPDISTAKTPETVAAPVRTSIGAGFTVAGTNTSNTSGRPGYTPKTYFDPNGNEVASGLFSATGRGGFVGASTDAQAAKALEDRVAQMNAAQVNIAQLNRGAEAERDTRAARLGISRGVLDRMEGRDSAAANAAVAAQSSTANDAINPMAMPGDSFQDTRGRQAAYDRAIAQATSGNTREQKGAAATLAGLNDLREKNLALQIARTKSQSDVDPMDYNRFLLDQQKFNSQQNVDRDKYLLDQEKLKEQQRYNNQDLALKEQEARDKQGNRELAAKKYEDAAREKFVGSYSFPDKNAPQAQIANDIFEMSRATGGKISPQTIASVYEKVVRDNKIDYGKGGPKDPRALNELVMTELTKMYRGK